MTELKQFDTWLSDDKFAALTARQLLESVDGADGVIFPPTFAPSKEGEKGNYNIDYFEGEYAAKMAYQHPNDAKLEAEIRYDKGGNVCLINSVGAEANRIEPLFMPGYCDGKFAKLVPQVVIQVKDKKNTLVEEINLLEAGHRAGDAIIRFTNLGELVFDAFKAIIDTDNSLPLAKIAPTSIVFGVWDSRGTQAKLPRVFRSVVRAYDVRAVTRSAQFNRALKYVESGVIDEKLDKGSGDNNSLSREGFKDNPATNSPGGVIVEGDIRREMTLNLSAIRRLRVRNSKSSGQIDLEQTLKLRRYILGLSLVAATAHSEERYNLREGCQLRSKPGHSITWQLIPFDGENQLQPDLNINVALKFAEAAAKDFGVGGPYEPTQFDASVAEKWLPLDKKVQDKRRRENPMTKQFPSGSKEGT